MYLYIYLYLSSRFESSRYRSAKTTKCQRPRKTTRGRHPQKSSLRRFDTETHVSSSGWSKVWDRGGHITEADATSTSRTASKTGKETKETQANTDQWRYRSETRKSRTQKEGKRVMCSVQYKKLHPESFKTCYRYITLSQRKEKKSLFQEFLEISRISEKTNVSELLNVSLLLALVSQK